MNAIDCREAHARLQDYLKRELTPELAAEMRAHLERCRPCFGHARFEESFLVMLEVQAGGARCCPDALRARILGRPAHRDGARLTPIAPPAALAAAAALLAWRARTLTGGGAVAAAVVGALVLVGTGWEGGAVLAAFFVSSNVVGRLAPGTAGLDPKGERRDPYQVRGQRRPRRARRAARAPRSGARDSGS